MRFLGSDPRVPADEIERLTMLFLHERVVSMKNAAAKEATKHG